MRTPILVLAGLSAILLSTPALAEGRLHIFNWGEYTSPELIAKFEAAHDVRVTVDEYDSNETMLARVRGGNSGYDIVVPGDYAVQVMIAQGFLEETRPDQMPNFRHVEERFIDVSWDPGRRYTAPWTHGLTSFAVNTDAYKGPADSIALLFDPPEALRGRIAMLDDMVSIIHAAERYVGVPRCTADRAELKQVRDALMKARPFWRTYSVDSINKLVSGEADVAQTWSGSAVVVRQQLPGVKFVFTREVMEGFSDNVAVLKGAPNLKNARLFQNFVMDPQNAALTSEFAGYANAIKGSGAFLSDALKTAPELDLPEDVAMEFVPPCPAEVMEVYSAIWTELRR